MTMRTVVALLTCLATLAVAQIEPDVEPLDYVHDGIELQGFVAIPDDMSSSPVPAVIIVPDWDGVNLYEQQRATMVAKEHGWLSFAADIYGKDLHQVENIDERIALATFYRDDPALFADRIQSAVDTVKELDGVDPERIALVGYCFGGTGVLTYLLQGFNDVASIVSVHGGLTNIPEPTKTTTTSPKVLVLSGGEDDTSTQIIDLEMTLNEINATWEITRFSGVQHAWTVFDAEVYDEWADMRTWDSMIHFLEECFDEIEFSINQPEAVKVEAVAYTDVDGTELQGYLALPDGFELPAPAVIIIPDWDGTNEYEQERATLLAEMGYVAFAADIYGKDLQTNLTMDEKRANAGLYRDDPTLFIQRMRRAMEQVKTYDSAVDGENIAVIGYCFGGTGVVHLAFAGEPGVKIIAAFHGGLRELPPVAGDIVPYTLILSGGDDDAHGNQTVLEEALNSGNASWEISRWSLVQHGFTKWDDERYSLIADARSWEQMVSVFQELMPVPQVASSDAVSWLASSLVVVLTSVVAAFTAM